MLKEHRKRQDAAEKPGQEDGWVFPSRVGTLRTPASLGKCWKACTKAAGITNRFTVHGLRRTFHDVVRRAGVDSVTLQSLTGHASQAMTRHYSTVSFDEKRSAVLGVVRLVGLDGGVDRGVDEAPETKMAS